MRPQPQTDMSGMSRQQAMNTMYSVRTVDISQHINKPLKPENVKRAASLGLKATGGIGAFAANAFIIQPLKYALYDYVADKLDPQTPDVVVDMITESILAEVKSSQQTESKPESAPSFIRPKKKKKLLYK